MFQAKVSKLYILQRIYAYNEHFRFPSTLHFIKIPLRVTRNIDLRNRRNGMAVFKISARKYKSQSSPKYYIAPQIRNQVSL